ncbi:MAG: alpha-galactosidase [Actinomycetota bacterium]|nr:alpha-galactosidase [Actinomycetota bacterium]MDA2972473.1 alpha-galactosidase [Actinomycetota bacterium]MDA3002038.1 alpha-galactosidase [Actinomycetota bacterium]
MDSSRPVVHLVGESVSVVLEVSGGVPVIEHWGSRVGSTDGWTSTTSGVPHGGLDEVVPLSVVPAEGFVGRPGLAGHRRGGRHWSPRFRHVDHVVDRDSGSSTLELRGRDEVAELDVVTRVSLIDDVMSIAVSLVNMGDGPYMLDALSVAVPVADRAVRLGTYSGRWGAEFTHERFDWPVGAWSVENRTGRTSHEHPPYLWALSRDADEWSGHVWGVHLAWSGNHVMYAERLVDGRRYVQTGELFHPGEMCVYPGETYTTPTVIGVYSSQGLSLASQGFHREARRRRPHLRSLRKVHLNTWEAVYFDHGPVRLKELAESAADLGVERFVLDDGWFGRRRDDGAGLGDWEVSQDVYPEGLTPLIDHVHSLGMDFGIWVEPEMVNPDSDVFRAHPDWVLSTEGYDAPLGRRQLVLDLARRDAFEHVLARLDTLLAENDIDYVKWDMNRWVVQGSGVDGKAGSHQQTHAVYRLIDELRHRHPGVEFESCASGGGRIDHEMLRRVERFWTSDNNDPTERARIHHGATMLLPPEVLGTHVGPSPAHNTGRRTSMAFRVALTLFGHMGVEADVTKLDERERAVLRHGIDLYKTHRDLVHSGRFFRVDRDPSGLCFGVESDDGREVLVCLMQIDSCIDPAHWRLPGLRGDEHRTIRSVSLVPGGGSRDSIGSTRRQPAWWESVSRDGEFHVSAEVLRTVGLPAPTLAPQRAVVLHVSCS